MILTFGLVISSLMCPVPFIKSHTLDKWQKEDYNTLVIYHKKCQAEGGCIARFERLEKYNGSNSYIIRCGKEPWLKEEREKNVYPWTHQPLKYLDL